jgi:hypothetical protein
MGSRTSCGHKILRTAGVLAPACMLALVLAFSASSASSSTTTDQAAFRRQFTTYLVQMQRVAEQLQATQQGRAASTSLGFDPAKRLARARAAAQRLTPEQLSILQRALSAYPAWRTMPATLGMLVRRMHVASPRSPAVADDCATARSKGYTQTDVEIAADASLAADIILAAIPDDTLALPARIIAVALWSAPQIALRVIEHSYEIAGACDDADHQALVTQNLDVKVSTRATQTSVDSLTNNFNTFNTAFNTFNTAFNTLNTLVNNRLDTTVSSRASQSSLDVFHNEFTSNATVVNSKLDAANTKLDNLTITVSDQGTLNLRMHIEADLSEPGNHPIALFEIPASAGGYLNLTRTIVADTIAKMQAAGESVGQAEAFLAAGDAALAAHDYKGAYADFGKAYRAAAS